MKLLSSACAAAGIVIVAANPAFSAELKIFGSRVTKMMVEDIGSQFERATGNQLVVATNFVAAMKRRIEAGDPVGRRNVRGDCNLFGA